MREREQFNVKVVREEEEREREREVYSAKVSVSMPTVLWWCVGMEWVWLVMGCACDTPPSPAHSPYPWKQGLSLEGVWSHSKAVCLDRLLEIHLGGGGEREREREHFSHGTCAYSKVCMRCFN